MAKTRIDFESDSVRAMDAYRDWEKIGRAHV